MSLFEDAGGEAGIRAVIETFYDAIFDDMMIGFFFARSNKANLVRVETQLVARALGATHIQYEGRPLRAAHAAHPIMGGHFDRRTQLLREALDEHNVPAPVREAWLEHTQALRSLITDDAGSECDHDAAARRMARLTGDS